MTSFSPAEGFQHLHVFFVGMIGSASAEVRLGDETAKSITVFCFQRFEFFAVGSEVDRFTTFLNRGTFFFRE